MTREQHVPSRRAQVAAWAMVLVVAAGVGGILWRWTTPGGPSARPMIWVASTGYVFVAVFRGAWKSRYGWCVLAGVLLCWVGDIVGPNSFLAGVAAFLVAHFGFMAAFWVRGVRPVALAGSLVLAAIVSGLIMYSVYPHVPPDQRVMIIGYVLTITAMLAFAGGTTGAQASLLIPIGAVAFYVSDVVLARRVFLGGSSMNTIFGYPIYYGSVVLLAWSAFPKRGRTEQENPRPPVE